MKKRFRVFVVAAIDWTHGSQGKLVIEKDEHGFYAWCPELKGCQSQGETLEEAVKFASLGYTCSQIHGPPRLANPR